MKHKWGDIYGHIVTHDLYNIIGTTHVTEILYLDKYRFNIINNK